MDLSVRNSRPNIVASIYLWICNDPHKANGKENQLSIGQLKCPISATLYGNKVEVRGQRAPL